MTYDFPIRYYEDNLIFNKDGNCWAVYRIKGISYDHLSHDKKIGILNAVTRFISNIASEAKIYIVPTAQDIEAHFAKLYKGLNTKDELYHISSNFIRGTENYLKEKLALKGVSNDYQVYIAVKLEKENSKENILSELAGLIKDPVKKINEAMGLTLPDISEREISVYKRAASAFRMSQNQRLGLEEVSSETIQWLIKRMMRRGIPGGVRIKTAGKNGQWHPMYSEVVEKDGEKKIRPYEKDILTLTEGEFEVSSKGLKITNSDGKASYQTFLTMSNIPDGIAFPGGEWLYMLQDYQVAVETLISIKNIDYRAASRKLDNKKTEIKSQKEHVIKNRERVPDELVEAEMSVDRLTEELSYGSEPLCMTNVSFLISADTEKERDDKANFIIDRYEDMHFSVERPHADQFKLFMDFIPGSERRMKDYIMPLPPKTVAGSMFPATLSLGDNEGLYIGTTGILKKNVYLDISRACKLNRSASCCFIGTLGGGKSFNANLLLFLQVMLGAYGLIIDPKAERGVWRERLPMFEPYISVTTLSPDEEDKGKLDPFLVSETIEEACELTKNILCELYNITTKDDEYLVISETLLKVKEHDKPSMLSFEKELLSFPEGDELYKSAVRLNRKISATKKIGMAGLLFGDGSSKGMSLEKRINILQIQNLNLPDPKTPKEDYTELERVSTVLMIPVAQFAKKFAMKDRKIFKMIIFDESWALNTTQVGASLFNFLSRMGRSLNGGSAFIGHSVTDLKGEGIREAITYKFIFKTVGNEEILRALNFLDLEPTDENIELLKTLPNRTCLFKDLDNRIGVLEWDAIWEDFINAFDTTPKDKKEEDYEK